MNAILEVCITAVPISTHSGPKICQFLSFFQKSAFQFCKIPNFTISPLQLCAQFICSNSNVYLYIAMSNDYIEMAMYTNIHWNYEQMNWVLVWVTALYRYKYFRELAFENSLSWTRFQEYTFENSLLRTCFQELTFKNSLSGTCFREHHFREFAFESSLSRTHFWEFAFENSLSGTCFRELAFMNSLSRRHFWELAFKNLLSRLLACETTRFPGNMLLRTRLFTYRVL
jgi:hypothetical protein